MNGQRNHRNAYGNWPGSAAALATFMIVGTVIAVLLRDIRFDDPFITYRYAENLTNGQGFVFNPGESTLITTAPLYALILAFFHGMGTPIPETSLVIGAISIIAAAWGLYLLGQNDNHARVGFMAGFGLLLFPLIWLTLGFETPLFLAVVIFALLSVAQRRWVLAGVLAGIATGFRGDGALIAGIVLLAALGALIGRLRIQHNQSLSQNLDLVKPAIKALVGITLTYLPFAVWLTLQFGSPLPTTLQSKSAQAVSGLTGFYPYTTYVEGAWLLIKAYIEQNPLVLIVMPIALLGIPGIARLPLHGLALPILWGMAHFAGYMALGVAPYVWYYTPLVPALVILMALGLDWTIKRLEDRSIWMRALPCVLSVALVLLALLNLWPIVTVVNGATPLPPSDLRAKLAPETKVDVYEQVGHWINTQTPVTATFGVTELGVMGYYAHRHIIDFLGLTQPQYLASIRHGDYLQALLREQPDYLALSSVNALYDSDPTRSEWFTQMYSPVVSFADDRFWGSPMTVWKRTQPVISTNIILDDAAHDIGDSWQVKAVQVNTRDIQGGGLLLLRIRLQAGKAIGARTLRVQPVLLGGGDGLPVSSRLVNTSQWRPGEVDWIDIPLVAQQNPPRGGYTMEIGWLEGGPTIHIGATKVSLKATARTDAVVVGMAEDIGVELLTQPIIACIGSTTPFTLTWHGGNNDGVDRTVFAQVREGNKVIAQADGPPRNGAYPTSVWSRGEIIPDRHQLTVPNDVTAGTHPLVIGLYNPADNTRMQVDPSPYRTSDGGVVVGNVIIQNCP